MLLEREVELEYRPRMLQALPNKVKAVADSLRDQTPASERCRQPMKRQDAEPLWSLKRHRGALSLPHLSRRTAAPAGSAGCGTGRVSGSLAGLLALLAVVAPYTLAAPLAWLRLGVRISPTGFGKSSSGWASRRSAIARG
jgi:hypothetical protein